ncbi:Ig-like domain-containing protein [Paramicrobacterium chengjingii]|uniref:Ig-like domain-containing protein n=1 Tax=Paramicrobacterium chengjingii TaxID=2769067 RepID=UPI00141DC283|nr:Ig-like domain-containing protein [Microbacterium chengjingii]
MRSIGRWRFFGLALVAVAALALPLMLSGPASAASTHPPVTTETDDGTDSTTPPNTGDPTITLNAPTDLVRESTLTVTGTVADPTSNASVRVKAGSKRWTTEPVVDGSFKVTIPVPQGIGVEIVAELVDDAQVNDSVSANVLFPLTIDAPSGPIGKNGSLSGGNAADGATVTVTIDGHEYTTTANASGKWAVSVTDEFSSASATATQTINGAGGESDPSNSVPITVDLTAPTKPRITEPSAGATVPPSGATISGTGEPGSTVKVFAGSQTLCTVKVPSSGAWSCTAAEVATSGAQKIVAKADDAAGNSSGDGAAVSVTFGTSSSPSDPPDKTPSDEPSDENSSPDDSDSTPKDEKPEPSESDDSDSRDEAVPPPAAPPNGPGPWNHATPFTASLPPALGIDAIAGWARALLLAIMTIALILIPARMLAGTMARRRVAASGVAFTGRNRTESEFDRAPMLAVPGRIAMIVLGIAATGALTIFANPVDGRPAYLRLLFAAIIASAIINAAAAWLPRILSHVWRCGFTEVRFNPRWLLVVAAAVLASRVFDLHPALLFALVTTVRVPTVLNSAVLARLALSRIGGVFVVGVVAWLLASFVPQGGSFFTQLLIETANITALVGIGSAAIMMVPLGRLSGRAIFAWSRPLWLAAVLAILTALFVMLGPSIENWRATGNVLAALALVLAFAALGISVWLWKRYVQPMLASS